MSCVNNIVGPYGVNTFGEAVHKELTCGKTTLGRLIAGATLARFLQISAGKSIGSMPVLPGGSSVAGESCRESR